MEIALFILGILVVISCVATLIFSFVLLKTFKAHCLDFAALANYIKDLMAFQETHSARILELATENATLKSELVAARSSNEDLTKSIDILSRQYLS